MRTLPSLGIGIGAPGLGAPTPSPGHTATLTVHRALDFHDGRDPHTTEVNHTWDGYTADTALSARLERLRGAGANVARNGMTLTVRRDAGEFSSVETLTFTDKVAPDEP